MDARSTPPRPAGRRGDDGQDERRGRDRRRDTAGDRAQTTIDFAIGAGVFLVTVAFVVAFVPTMLQPFDTGSQDHAVTADRIATQLAGGTLGSPSTPAVLDTGCTVAFFNSTVPDPGLNCRYGATSVGERVGLPAQTNLQVRFAGDLDDDVQETLCWVAATDTLAEVDDVSCDVTLSTGPTPAGAESVVVAVRFVSVDGTPALLEVRTW
jgi:hypothetical protein